MPNMTTLSDTLLLVWIKGSEAHREELKRRFDRAPKPMYYRPEMLLDLWAEFTAGQDQVDPDAFLRFGYARLLDARQPRYAAMANWGLTVTAEEVATVKDASGFHALIAASLDRSAAAA